MPAKSADLRRGLHHPIKHTGRALLAPIGVDFAVLRQNKKDAPKWTRPWRPTNGFSRRGYSQIFFTSHPTAKSFASLIACAMNSASSRQLQ